MHIQIKKFLTPASMLKLFFSLLLCAGISGYLLFTSLSHQTSAQVSSGNIRIDDISIDEGGGMRSSGNIVFTNTALGQPFAGSNTSGGVTIGSGHAYKQDFIRPTVDVWAGATNAGQGVANGGTLTVQRNQDFALSWAVVGNPTSCILTYTTTGINPNLQYTYASNPPSPAQNASLSTAGGTITIKSPQAPDNMTLTITCSNAAGTGGDRVQVIVNVDPFIQTSGGDVHSNEDIINPGGQ